MNAIEVDSLTKRYGRTAAVNGVSFAVGEGEVFGYLGPNGAGKTTTIRCMLGLIAPTSGAIRIFGMDLAHHRHEILGRIGFLPGELGLWPRSTGRACLGYLGRLLPPPRRRAELCERLELAEADLDRPVRTYSRGMKQKIGIVQALQHAPELLILDEPTEGLDPVMQDRFIELLNEHRASGGTAFLSSHILSEVERTTERVAVLRDGRIVRVGSPRDLTGQRVRHFTIALKRPRALDRLRDLPGVSDLVQDGASAHFDFSGDVEPLLRALSALGLEDMTARPATLTESFFEVYGEERAP